MVASRSVRNYLIRLTGSGILALLFALFGHAAFADAAIAHVTGTVTDQNGISLGSVSVTAVPLDGGNSNGPVPTSPTDGSYDITVDTGTAGHSYDFHFSPPSGSGLNGTVISNLLVTTDQVLSIVLT